MKKIARIFVSRINGKTIAVLTSMLLLIMLVPIYRLALYATPFYDDFNYANPVRMVWENSHSLGAVFAEAWQVVVNTFYSWQGTYSSVFLMSLMPASYGFNYYFIGIFAIITAMVIGIWYLSYSLFRLVANGDRVDSLSCANLITLIIIELFYSAQQGIYWYNGAVHYSFAHGVMLVLLAFAVRYLYSERTCGRIGFMAGMCLLSVYVAGTNFVTALQGILLLLLIGFFGVFLRKKHIWIMVLPIALYSAGMVISITAPGNAHRQALYDGYARGAVDSILMSFKSAVVNLPKYTGPMFVAAFLVLIPVFMDILKKNNMKFRYPGLVTLFSFCLYATGFTPSWYGIGEEGLARTLCVVKVTFLLLAFSITKDKAGSYFTYGSYYYVHTGEAYNYYSEQRARDEFIKNSPDADVELEPLVWRPWFLCKKNELDANPDSEQNSAAARWYGKNSIYVIEE